MLSHKLKFIFSVIGFVVVVCLCSDYLFTRYLTKTNECATSNKLYRLIEEEHNNEITIFGSSRAEKGYFCDTIHANCYNYGFPNQSFDVTTLLLSFELAKPKTTPIIIDIHHDFYVHDAVVNINLDTYLPFINSNATLQHFLAENKRLQPYHYIPGARYFGAYCGYLKPIIEQRFNIGNTHYLKGGVYDTKTGSNHLEKRIAKWSEKQLSFTIDKNKEMILIDMIQQHPERNFVFVVSPYHWSAKASVTNFDEMLNYFGALDNQFKNVTTINVDASNFEDDLFKDTVHLNEKGAQQFSASLKESLISRGIF